MIIIRPTAALLSESDLSLCIDFLRRGKIISYPTETFYALGVDPGDKAAVERLYQIKGRTAEKQLPLIAADTEMVKQFCDTKALVFEHLADRFWPGPLTMVLPVRNRNKTAAVRVSSHPIARQLSHALGGPIVSTSANQSGSPPHARPDQVADSFGRDLEVLIDAGICAGELPSTILSLVEPEPKILREGPITAEMIREAL